MSTTHLTETEALHVFRHAHVEGPTITVPAEIDIPSDDDFAMEDVDYLPAPEVEAIATRLRGEKPHFADIRGYRIAYFWKRKGGSSGGKAVLGKCQRTPALAKALKPSTWTIWLAADHLREFDLTPMQLEALIFHELLHAALKEVEVKDRDTGETDTEYRPAVVGHDLEMFHAEVVEYGLWTMELQRARDLFTQTELPGLADPIAAGGQV